MGFLWVSCTWSSPSLRDPGSQSSHHPQLPLLGSGGNRDWGKDSHWRPLLAQHTVHSSLARGGHMTKSAVKKAGTCVPLCLTQWKWTCEYTNVYDQGKCFKLIKTYLLPVSNSKTDRTWKRRGKSFIRSTHICWTNRNANRNQVRVANQGAHGTLGECQTKVAMIPLRPYTGEDCA